MAAFAPAVAPMPLSVTALEMAPVLMTLTTLETDLVVATGPGLLALVAASRGLAQTRTNSASDAALGVLGAISVFNVVEFHQQPLREL